MNCLAMDKPGADGVYSLIEADSAANAPSAFLMTPGNGTYSWVIKSGIRKTPNLQWAR